MKAIIITKDLAARGMRVVPGPDWREDQNRKGVGTIIGEESYGWVMVQWDTGNKDIYRVGAEGAYDLVTYVGATKQEKVQELRDSLSQNTSIKSEQKSNNDEHTRDTIRTPIKVRAVISTIKRSERRSYTPITGRRS